MSDFSHYQGDKHANARDRKRARREIDGRMRGNRSVFEIEKAILKRSQRRVK